MRNGPRFIIAKLRNRRQHDAWLNGSQISLPGDMRVALIDIGP
jgi:hypothetical protein